LHWHQGEDGKSYLTVDGYTTMRNEVGNHHGLTIPILECVWIGDEETIGTERL